MISKVSLLDELNILQETHFVNKYGGGGDFLWLSGGSVQLKTRVSCVGSIN
jgi:hypothetical protein